MCRSLKMLPGAGALVYRSKPKCNNKREKCCSPFLPSQLITNSIEIVYPNCKEFYLTDVTLCLSVTKLLLRRNVGDFQTSV